MLYQAANPKTEVLGRNILSYMEGMGAFEMMGRMIFAQHGIEENPDPDKWYNHQAFLDALKEISTRTGVHTINLIGGRIAEKVNFPQDVDDLEKALKYLDLAYRLVHRGDDKSAKTVTAVEKNHLQIVIRTPYPCEFDHGYLRVIVKRFKPESSAMVKHDNTQACRNHGGESCTYQITW